MGRYGCRCNRRDARHAPRCPADRHSWGLKHTGSFAPSSLFLSLSPHPDLHHLRAHLPRDRRCCRTGCETARSQTRLSIPTSGAQPLITTPPLERSVSQSAPWAGHASASSTTRSRVCITCLYHVLRCPCRPLLSSARPVPCGIKRHRQEGLCVMSRGSSVRLRGHGGSADRVTWHGGSRGAGLCVNRAGSDGGRGGAGADRRHRSGHVFRFSLRVCSCWVVGCAAAGSVCEWSRVPAPSQRVPPATLRLPPDTPALSHLPLHLSRSLSSSFALPSSCPPFLFPHFHPPSLLTHTLSLSTHTSLARFVCAGVGAGVGGGGRVEHGGGAAER